MPIVQRYPPIHSDVQLICESIFILCKEKRQSKIDELNIRLLELRVNYSDPRAVKRMEWVKENLSMPRGRKRNNLKEDEYGTEKANQKDSSVIEAETQFQGHRTRTQSTRPTLRTSRPQLSARTRAD